MNFTDLKAEFAARGFDDMSDTRQGYYVNRARARLDAMRLWPYREKSVTGSPAPLSITDLGVVDEVIDIDNDDQVLVPISWNELAANVGDTSLSGTPEYWYFASPNGAKEIATYPTSDHTIGVQYWCVTTDLSAGSDTPAAPSAYHLLIVDIAAQTAARDIGDFAMASALQADIDRQVSEMVVAEMGSYGVSEIGAIGDDC